VPNQRGHRVLSYVVVGWALYALSSLLRNPCKEVLRLSRKRWGIQEIDFFLLDEPLQLRYNLPATGWSLVSLYSAPPRAEGVDGSLAIIPDQRELGNAGRPTTTTTPGSSNRQDMRLWTVESGFESLPRNFCTSKAPSSRGQGRCPLTAETRVRISVGPLQKSTTSTYFLSALLPLVSVECLSCCENPRPCLNS
jgi:hypothetical protein